MWRKKWRKKQQGPGFTIVELLIVIAVIGILAAITIVAYTGISNNARLSTLKSDLSGNGTALAIYNVNNGAFPPDLTTAALKASSGTTYQYTYTSLGNTYCLTGTNNAISYYITNSNTDPTAGACPGDVNGGGGGGISDGSSMQTITSSNCPATRTRAVDARDSHTYWVQKLSDGKCWMLTNLAYAGGGTGTYSDTKTLTNGTGGSTTFTTASYYIVPSTTNFTTEPTSPSTSTSGTGQYGYLYNWCGAMGGQATSACANATTPAPIATTSVCPAGWRLPTGNGGEFGALNTAVNGGSTSSDAGLLTTWLGQLSGQWYSSFSQAGSDGWYWSSTQNSANNAYLLGFVSSTVIPTYNDFKVEGAAVRCIAN